MTGRTEKMNEDLEDDASPSEADRVRLMLRAEMVVMESRYKAEIDALRAHVDAQHLLIVRLSDERAELRDRANRLMHRLQEFEAREADHDDGSHKQREAL